MDQTTLLYIMTAFVIVAAIALCIQAGMLVALYSKTKMLQEKINPLVDKISPLVPKAEVLLESAKATVEQSKVQIVDITNKASEIMNRANEIMGSVKNQLAMVEEVVSDATTRAKIQMERVELVLDDTINRTHETIATVHNGIMRPLQEINGVVAGVRAALAFLARNDRASVAQATSDEEMFI
jgi:ElaB/YqjD/DUF883 family membrane-anchored ribosome-binding protein